MTITRNLCRLLTGMLFGPAAVRLLCLSDAAGQEQLVFARIAFEMVTPVVIMGEDPVARVTVVNGPTRQRIIRPDKLTRDDTGWLNCDLVSRDGGRVTPAGRTEPVIMTRDELKAYALTRTECYQELEPGGTLEYLITPLTLNVSCEGAGTYQWRCLGITAQFTVLDPAKLERQRVADLPVDQMPGDNRTHEYFLDAIQLPAGRFLFYGYVLSKDPPRYKERICPFPAGSRAMATPCREGFALAITDKTDGFHLYWIQFRTGWARYRATFPPPAPAEDSLPESLDEWHKEGPTDKPLRPGLAPPPGE